MPDNKTVILLVPDDSVAPTDGIVNAADRLEAQIGPFELRVWPQCAEPPDVEFILMVGHTQVDFDRFKGLRAIMTLSAGIDHLGDLNRFPADVPIVRLIDPSLIDQIVEYVLLNVLRFHRLDPQFRALQSQHEWKVLFPKRVGEVAVGVAGPGVLGGKAMDALRGLGYPVSCWSRTEKHITGVRSFAGATGLRPFLEATDILVSLLPLTGETLGLFNAETLGRLPRGASFINAGRGALVIEADLLELLDSGHLNGAALDVFQHEPLPPEHPLWDHPKVFITPHAAAHSYPDTGIEQVGANIRRIRAGRDPVGLVDRDRGY